MTPFPMSPYAPPDADALVTLYEDEAVIIADKPAGLLSVPGRAPEKAFCAVSILSERHGAVLTVHRLDMDTSGIMVFARTKAAQSSLSRAFQERKVTKAYLAMVEGRPNPASGTIDLPIAAHSLQRPLRHITEDGRPAITHFETLKSTSNKSLIQLTPETGRSHQLRLHLKALGHPILGDRFYGDGKSAKRLMLHAFRLGFPHPETGQPVRFTAPEPDCFL